jgi:fused signal recognition particle receptor
MGLFDKFKTGLQKTHARLVHELKRVVTRSPKLTAATLEELEAALIAADLGTAATQQIVEAVKRAYESQGRGGTDVLAVARGQIESLLASARPALHRAPDGLTVISLVGVNGTGKTTTTAKLAHLLQSQGGKAVIAACDTFRAAAIEQLKLWGQRLNVPVIAGAYSADPAAVAHDAVSAATAQGAGFLLVDTAGRLHTKHNLMQELQKLHRVLGRKLPGAPHETVSLTGLVITKLDGTSKGGMVVAIQKELGLPVKFIGLGEQPDDLQAFDAREFAAALFADEAVAAEA